MLYQDADDKVLERDIYVDLNEAEIIGSTDRVHDSGQSCAGLVPVDPPLSVRRLALHLRHRPCHGADVAVVDLQELANLSLALGLFVAQVGLRSVAALGSRSGRRPLEPAIGRAP